MSLAFVPCGGLGNLLFQHNAAYALAKESGLELSAPGYYPEWRPQLHEYSNLFKHVNILGTKLDSVKHPQFDLDPDYFRLQIAIRLSGQNAVYKEPCFKYAPIPKYARIIQGYFQSWKYFDKYRTEIRDLLKNNELELWEKQKAKFNGGVCVHIRWGGDGSYPHLFGIYPQCTVDYYRQAMDKFKGSKFLVFCEEPHLVKDLDIWEGKDVEIIDEPHPLATLFLMSCCDHFIIANSSLSLMAYYLREVDDATVTAPTQWFGAKGPEFDIHDLVKV